MRRQRILIVDDHEPLLAAVQHVLEGADYTVMTATNGEEALLTMEEVHPDLIVADIMMPRMDGYALYEAVRARQEWVPIPFIFLTAKAEKRDVLKGKMLGVEDYITKPFDPQELLIAVQARLGRAQAIQEAAGAEFEQLKHQIINILSHELRTPLTYIQGYTTLALEDISSLSPEALQEFLEAIKHGGDRLTRLVEDLLLMIRLDTGQTRREFRMLAKVHSDLDAIVERTVHRYERQAAAEGVTLETATAPGLPPVKLCEPFFADALGRLLDNGIKFSRGESRRVIVSSRVTNGWVEVAVQDEGIGVAPSDLPRLFERFRQIDRERMEQQGTGLGLAIARALVRVHGGEIGVESKLGEGSTFAIRLPAAEAPKEA